MFFSLSTSEAFGLTFPERKENPVFLSINLIKNVVVAILEVNSLFIFLHFKVTGVKTRDD